eukprot:5956046-Amphidinium_carterae.4
MVSDSFADRATGTLALRTSAVGIFVKRRGHFHLLTEDIAYNYVSDRRKVHLPHELKAEDLLTFQQLRALELLLLRQGLPPEACARGHCLFAAHPCASWSDILALKGPVAADPALVEATSKHLSKPWDQTPTYPCPLFWSPEWCVRI